jgi:hypothetical protein
VQVNAWLPLQSSAYFFQNPIPFGYSHSLHGKLSNKRLGTPSPLQQ